MKLVELTHRKWEGEGGQKARVDLDDVVVYGGGRGDKKEKEEKRKK
jgi:hypothetical protein